MAESAFHFHFDGKSRTLSRKVLEKGKVIFQPAKDMANELWISFDKSGVFQVEFPG